MQYIAFGATALIATQGVMDTCLRAVISHSILAFSGTLKYIIRSINGSVKRTILVYGLVYYILTTNSDRSCQFVTSKGVTCFAGYVNNYCIIVKECLKHCLV